MKSLSMFTFVLLMIGAQPALAACAQADGAGIWRFFTADSAAVAPGAVSFNATRGYLAFSSAGVLTRGSVTRTGVNSSYNIAHVTGAIAAGQARITVQASCRVFGYVILGGIRNNIEGWMTRDKGSIAGIGWADSNTAPNTGWAGTFSLDMVRQ